MNERQRKLLHVMGVRTWQERGAMPPPKPLVASSNANRASANKPKQGSNRPLPAQTAAKVEAKSGLIVDDNPIAPDVTGADWQLLMAKVSACRLCSLCETRTQTVFGVGNQQADWMFIGEAPGAEEDRRGEPFVGRAGQLLDSMLNAINLDRGSAYIANTLKCRPPGNRDPQVDEMKMCENYLHRQIDLIKPKLIVAVGRIAAHRLLSTTDSLARLRGKVHHYGAMKIPLIVTYHPAYLLRSPGQKRKAWEDLLLGASITESANQ